MTYRQYRNKLTSLLRAAKDRFYKDQLKENQGNLKVYWKSINSLIGRTSNVRKNIEIKPHCSDLPNLCNDNFLKIGDEVNYEH